MSRAAWAWVLLLSMLHLGPGSLGRPVSGAPLPTRVLFALFDVSGSTQGQRGQYRKDFERIIMCSLGAGLRREVGHQRVVGDRITANPLGTSEFRINHEIRPYDPLRMTQVVYMGQGRKILQKADEVLRGSGPERGTGIMEAMQLSEKVFRTYAGDQRILVVFSDMYEQSARYDFASESLTPARRRAIINRERSEGRLPALHGVKVYVVGAGAQAGGPGGAAQRAFLIMDFWLEYFAAAGADLTKERYGSALLAFEGC